jgi:dipeptidyl aminopeptidase/acylaminoacyl peptidase
MIENLHMQTAKALKAISGFLVLGSLLPAAERSFTIEQVMSAPFASAPLAAPVGARVAWLENEQGKRNVWVAEAPGWRGRRLTSFEGDDGQEIAELTWAPDGSYLLFARGGDFENGGENPNPDFSLSKPAQEIWSAPIEGAPKKLTEGRAPAASPRGDIIAFLRGGQIFTMRPNGDDAASLLTQKGTVSGLSWSPDGAALAFVNTRAEHSFIGIYLPAEKSVRYLDPSVDKDSDPVWSPDGSRLAFLRIPTGGPRFGPGPQRQGEPWSIRIADLKSGVGRQVFIAANGAGSVFRGIEAEHQIYWAANERLLFPWERTGWRHLYSLPVSGGAPVELTPGDGEVEHVAIARDRQTIYFSANFTDIDRRHLWSVDTQGGAAPKAITSGDGVEWQPVPLAQGAELVFLASSYNQRAQTEVLLADGKRQLLVPDIVPAGFPATSLVRPQAVTITAADGLAIHGQLFLPPAAKSGQRHPALVFFHGGSRRQMLLGFHYMYYYSNAYSLNQYLANQGYVVLSVNYRSGIGYGLDFREALHYGAQGGSEFNDVIGAGLYLKARPDVDPRRIGVWGGSYGGYLTAMALARASDLFAAGVDFHGVHDWSTLRDYPTATQGGDPNQERELHLAVQLAFESSPMAFVDTWKSPVLLIHGDDDRNVSFSQTVTLVEALRQRHVYFEELIFPNEIHDFLRYRDWLTAYTSCADFFSRLLPDPGER